MSAFQPGIRPEPITEADMQAACMLAAADMLVLRALELVGKRTLRATRSRRTEAAEIPFIEGHLHFRVDSDDLDKALAGAWVHVPLLIASHGVLGVGSEQMELALDRYVRDLILGRVAHETENLRFVLRQFTG